MYQDHQKAGGVNFSSYICENGHPIRLLCCNKDCDQCALVCSAHDCKYAMSHAHCTFVMGNPLLQNILSKKRSLKEELEESFEALEKIYDEAIQILSEQKQKVRLWKENFGLSVEESKLVNALLDHDRKLITGALLSTVNKNLKKQVSISPVTKDMLDRRWKNKKNAFEGIFQMLSELLDPLTPHKHINPFLFDFDMNIEHVRSHFNFNAHDDIIEKINTNVAHICSIQPLPQKGRVFFDVEILTSLGAGIATGIIAQSLRTDREAYNNARAIKYFTTGGYLYNCTTMTNVYKIPSANIILRTIIDITQKKISWEIDDKEVVSAPISDQLFEQPLYISVEFDTTQGQKIRKIW